MILIKQIRHFFIIMSLAIMLVITVAFDFGTSDTWAANLLKPIISQPQTQMAKLNQSDKMTDNAVKDLETHEQNILN